MNSSLCNSLFPNGRAMSFLPLSPPSTLDQSQSLYKDPFIDSNGYPRINGSLPTGDSYSLDYMNSFSFTNALQSRGYYDYPRSFGYSDLTPASSSLYWGFSPPFPCQGHSVEFGAYDSSAMYGSFDNCAPLDLSLSSASSSSARHNFFSNSGPPLHDVTQSQSSESQMKRSLLDQAAAAGSSFDDPPPIAMSTNSQNGGTNFDAQANNNKLELNLSSTADTIDHTDTELNAAGRDVNFEKKTQDSGKRRKRKSTSASSGKSHGDQSGSSMPVALDPTSSSHVKRGRASSRSSKREEASQCSYCNRWFCSTWSRLSHERTHTGQNRHYCKVCHRSFPVAHNHHENTGSNNNSRNKNKSTSSTMPSKTNSESPSANTASN